MNDSGNLSVKIPTEGLDVHHELSPAYTSISFNELQPKMVLIRNEAQPDPTLGSYVAQVKPSTLMHQMYNFMKKYGIPNPYIQPPSTLNMKPFQPINLTIKRSPNSNGIQVVRNYPEKIVPQKKKKKPPKKKKKKRKPSEVITNDYFTEYEDDSVFFLDEDFSTYFGSRKKRKRTQVDTGTRDKKKRKVDYEQAKNVSEGEKSKYLMDMNIDLWIRTMTKEDFKKETVMKWRIQQICVAALTSYTKRTFDIELEKSHYVFVLETPYQTFFNKMDKSGTYVNGEGEYVIPLIFAFLRICHDSPWDQLTVVACDTKLKNASNFCGAGTILMDHIKDYVKNVSKKSHIVVFSDRSPCANRYYQKMGFKYWEDWETDPVMDDDWKKKLDVPIIVHMCTSVCFKFCQREGRGRHKCTSMCRKVCPDNGKRLYGWKAPFYLHEIK